MDVRGRNEFEVLQSDSYGGLGTFVLVRTKSKQSFKIEGLGLSRHGGVAGNKGVLATKISINGKKILFCNHHLKSGESHTDRKQRREMFASAMKELNIDQYAAVFQAGDGNTRSDGGETRFDIKDTLGESMVPSVGSVDIQYLKRFAHLANLLAQSPGTILSKNCCQI